MRIEISQIHCDSVLMESAQMYGIGRENATEVVIALYLSIRDSYGVVFNPIETYLTKLPLVRESALLDLSQTTAVRQAIQGAGVWQVVTRNGKIRSMELINNTVCVEWICP
jgi:hypothetical protein